ncbi:hypothetical protein C8R47DRAFT_1180912 [Mycena vitilis]|nr:hypothetical protein C8R47DRAFT_1180912 [Mycena vitilis]
MSAFSLSNRRLILGSSEDIHAAIQAVDFKTVTSFSVNGNSIGAGAGVALGELLHLAVRLETANVSDMFSQRNEDQIPAALAAICKGLMHKSSLVELDLSDNAIGPIAIESIVPLLLENHSLRILKLNNVGFGPVAGTIAAKALHLAALIQAMHNRPPNLRVIVCGRSRLETAASAWAEMFAANTNLVAVDIHQSAIREKGLSDIARALKNCRSLRYLDISDNLTREESLNSTRLDTDVDAASAFAEALPLWPDLEYLSMSDCCVEASGTSQIIDALSKGQNTMLTSLLLENAGFADSFGTKLLDALETKVPNLVTLKLAEHDDLGDTEHGVWAKIVEIITGRGGVTSFERDIDDLADTTALDRILSDVGDESASIVAAMTGLSVSRT